MSETFRNSQSRWLLPALLRRDAFDVALADEVDAFGADAWALMEGYSTWDRIGQMGEAELDALAAEMNILYYDPLADVDAKREVVRQSRLIQAKLGTKWALEEILKIYFDAGAAVTEWFDYETQGEPNHFRIETDFTADTPAETARFLGVVSQVKRKSAVLDGIVAVTRADTAAQAAAYVQESATETMEMRGR